MFENFTDGARMVMQLANHEAQRLKHEYIGSEHILLGLILRNSTATHFMRTLGCDLEAMKLELAKIVLPGTEIVLGDKLPQTPRAKKVIEYAIEEARSQPVYYVGEEHVLLGCLREAEGLAAQILRNFGVTIERVRGVVKAAAAVSAVAVAPTPLSLLKLKLLSDDRALAWARLIDHLLYVSHVSENQADVLYEAFAHSQAVRTKFIELCELILDIRGQPIERRPVGL